MARLGRWKGALVLQTATGWWLIGQPKEPCPLCPDTLLPPYVQPLPGPVELTASLELEEEDGALLAPRLAARLLIARNGSTSERLWRLVCHNGATSAAWLTEIPAHVWEVVREAILRCS